MNSKKSLVTLVSTFLLISCATAGVDKKVPDYPTKEPEHSKHEEYLPIVMRFKRDGTPQIFRADGTIIKGEKVRPPIKTTQIESFETISYIKYAGSCKLSFLVDGEMVEFGIPHQYCSHKH